MVYNAANRNYLFLYATSIPAIKMCERELVRRQKVYASMLIVSLARILRTRLESQFSTTRLVGWWWFRWVVLVVAAAFSQSEGCWSRHRGEASWRACGRGAERRRAAWSCTACQRVRDLGTGKRNRQRHRERVRLRDMKVSFLLLSLLPRSSSTKLLLMWTRQ